MDAERGKLLMKFWQALGERASTGNIPLTGGNLTVSLRELDRMTKQGLNIDPEKRARCLLVEGYISIKKVRYYVRYINYESGYVDWEFCPDSNPGDLTVPKVNLTQRQFEDYLIKNILPIFFEKTRQQKH